MGCVPCGRGFHGECRKGCAKCHPEPVVEQTVSLAGRGNNEQDVKTPKRNKENLRDPESTGRKRAARLYPIESDAPCEWRGLRNCGGGRRPIVGCLSGNQQHRHHGPVKDTTRNESGNVHRICDDCHLHWHELNDLVYDEADYRLLPHQPEPATEQEIIQTTIFWKTGEMGKKFELASSRNRKRNEAWEDSKG